MNIDTKSLEKAFYADGFNIGIKAANIKNDRKSLLPAVTEMYSAIDALIDSFSLLAAKQDKNIDCKSGCEWCCHQPVFAMDYELDYLQTFISEYFDSELKNEIISRAIAKQNNFGKLKGDKLQNAKHACPLLNEGACMAYKARPMACRIYLSSDVKSCVHFYKSPEDKNSYPALLDLPMRLGRMMNEGFKAALKTKGIDAKEFRIEELLSIQLT